jgi:hypothetical protein
MGGEKPSVRDNKLFSMRALWSLVLLRGLWGHVFVLSQLELGLEVFAEHKESSAPFRTFSIKLVNYPSSSQKK